MMIHSVNAVNVRPQNVTYNIDTLISIERNSVKYVM